MFSGVIERTMEGLIFTIFENLNIPVLSFEECTDSLYYINTLIDKEESPESFIKYQMIKIKIEKRLTEIRKEWA
ncbi:hypothetical protein AHMF7605_21255 [Adhaeribacter arboris]|uniref:Uncharacterized protein n=1 Tax=Adhaeribacter arboris TaxID=2072846 RepID=A0A2T2YK50_9BACT|nr:hypothetical protein AHMF7605_21255 [Adhaeribacter arboris]